MSSENTGLLVLPFRVSVFISERCEGEEAVRKWVRKRERERKRHRDRK